MKKNNRHIVWTSCAAMLFLLIGQNSAAQSDISGRVTRPLFTSESTLAISIEAPFKTIMRDRDETEQYPATLKYSDADGAQHVFDINLRVRGKFRQQRRNCNFVPLWVNFKKKAVAGTVFAGQDKIKLVTDCQRATPSYQQLLLKEYLAYKMFNLMTENSFSARLLQITYIDNVPKGKTRTSYGIFLEDKKHIAERLGLKRVKIERAKYTAFDPVQSNLMNVYEYLIGNTDYSQIAGPVDTTCCHNTVIYQKGDEPYITIPFDFDHAGLVFAPYAEPNPRFKIKNVKKRVYRGRCANNFQLDATMQHYLAKRDDIRQLIQGFEGFNKRSIKQALAYVDSFFKIAADPKSVQVKLANKCSG
jgi:hypothetical protein